MSYERPYYKDINYHPFIFYVVFGIDDSKVEISKSKHHVEQMPEGLDIIICDREQNNDYMQTLVGGALGYVLSEHNPELYKKAVATNKWAIIRGEIANDSTLDYMRDTIGIVQAFIETGAVGVLDLQRFELISSDEWSDVIFTEEFNALSHVTIYTTQFEDGLLWLHTRGMLKFGRPDIGVKNVTMDSAEDATQIINQMINYGCIGVFFDKPTKLYTYTGKSFIVKAEYINDMDNDDYNNAYYDIAWENCEEVPIN